MPIDPDYLLTLPPRITEQRYTARDTILYAIGVGAGSDPDDLKHVYEKDLIALPTMAVVLAYPGFWQKEPRYGIDWRRVLHGAQSTLIHSSIPVEGHVRGEMRIEKIADKGAERGVLLQWRRDIFEVSEERLLATVRQVSFLRGDGGCGGPSEPIAPPHTVPDRDPDEVIALPTRPDQAIIYRLSGDYNPLHVDPEVALSANLPAPILHGLCTYGVVARGLLRASGARTNARLQRMDCRFTAPVFPGETIEVAVWHEPSGRAAFRARVVERDVIVLGNGYAEFKR